MAGKKQTADVNQKMDIYDRLKELIIKHDDGTVSYRNDYTDKRLAAELNVGEASVSYIRTKRFGSFIKERTKRSGTSPTPNELTMIGKISSLEQEIADLRAKLAEAANAAAQGEIVNRFNKLCDEVGKPHLMITIGAPRLRSVS